MSAPLNQSIVDMLRDSALAPVLNRPVNDVLADMGLPALPQLPPAPPLPELPPLPVLDLHALTKPLTDLAGSFGTGQAGAGGNVDPSQVLSQVSQVLQTVMSLGTSALQVAMTLWQSQGANSAADKTTQAATDNAAVSAQGGTMAVDTVAATGSVFTGNAQMTAVTAKYLTSLAAAAPFLVLPGGQAFVLAASVEAVTEALAVVAKTRAELTAHTAKMAKTGQKVKVTNAPKDVDPSQSMQEIQQLMGLVSPLTSAVTQGAQAIAQALPKQTAKLDNVDQANQADAPGSLDSAGGAGGGGGDLGGGGGGLGALGGGLGGAPLGPAQTLGALGSARAATSLNLGGGASALPAEEIAATNSAASSSPGMMPMGAGAAGAARAAGEQQSSEAMRGQLITAQHGNEVVGPMAGAAIPVVGAADEVSVPADQDTPDKALTL